MGKIPAIHRAIEDIHWRLERAQNKLGTAIANHDFSTAHSEYGRIADAVHDLKTVIDQHTPKQEIGNE